MRENQQAKSFASKLTETRKGFLRKRQRSSGFASYSNRSTRSRHSTVNLSEVSPQIKTFCHSLRWPFLKSLSSKQVERLHGVCFVLTDKWNSVTHQGHTWHGQVDEQILKPPTRFFKPPGFCLNLGVLPPASTGNLP